MAEDPAAPLLTRRPLEMADLLAHQPRQEQAAEHAAAVTCLKAEGLDLMARLGSAWAFGWGDAPVAVGGLIRRGPGLLSGWALVDGRARPEALRALIRSVRKTLAATRGERIEISVRDGFAAGARTAATMGFAATDRHLSSHPAMPGTYRIWEQRT